MDKFFELIDVLHKGKAVSNPEVWKNRQVLISLLAPLILALAAITCSYGFCLPVSEEASIAIASGIFAVVNILLTWSTSKKVGLRPKHADDGSDDPSGV